MLLSDKWGNGFQAGLILLFNVKTIVLIYKCVVFPVQTGCLSEAIWWSARSCHRTLGLYFRFIKSCHWHSCGSGERETEGERKSERENEETRRVSERKEVRNYLCIHPTYRAGESRCHNDGMQTALSIETEPLREDRHGLLTIQYHGMDRKPQHSFRNDYSL